MGQPHISRKTQLSLEKIDASRAKATAGSRVDYELSAKFRQFMIHWAGISEDRWKNLAVLCLREICGWTTEMLGVTFGHPRGHISRLILSTKAALATGFAEHFRDHKVDSYVYLKVADAMELAEYLDAQRYASEVPQKMIEVQSILSDQLRKWEGDDESFTM